MGVRRSFLASLRLVAFICSRWSSSADVIQINNNVPLLRMNKIVFMKNQLFTMKGFFLSPS